MKQQALVALLALGFAACAPSGPQPSTEIAAMSGVWEEAFNAGNIDALVGMYTEDSRIMAPNAETGEGLDAARAAFGEMIEAGLTGELETIEAVTSGDLGYRIGTYAIRTPDGVLADRGKYVELWRKVDGEWKIYSDIWNSNLPESAPAGATMLITHEVQDAARWIAAFQGTPSRRELFAQHGVHSVRVFQNPDNPKLTGLLLGVSDMQAMEAFLQSPEAQAAKAADGVKDPTLRVFSEVQ